MGRYLDLAKQIPIRSIESMTPPIVEKNAVRSEPSTTTSGAWQRDSLNRLIGQSAGYVQISCKDEEVYIALTDSEFHDLTQRPGLTVYHAAHLIELSDEEIRLMHSLRTINGPGGSVEVGGGNDRGA